MNSAPLLLLPLAAITLLTSKPAPTPGDPSDAAPSIDQEAVQALTAQLRQTTESLQTEDGNGTDRPAHRRHGRNRIEQEFGLHTGHLSTSGLSAPVGESYSGARGLTPADEWQQMFPKYALKTATEP